MNVLFAFLLLALASAGESRSIGLPTSSVETSQGRQLSQLPHTIVITNDAPTTILGSSEVPEVHDKNNNEKTAAGNGESLQVEGRALLARRKRPPPRPPRRRKPANMIRTTLTATSTAARSPSPPPPVVVLQANTGSSMSAGDVASTLAEHNRLRANHGAPPMQWDNNLAAFAQNWADNCNFAHSGGRYGENMGIGSGAPASIITKWYSEICDYNFGAPGFTAPHFSQIVWASSQRVGCATSNCPGMRLLVCEYDAPGNVGGAYSANVFPPASSIARC